MTCKTRSKVIYFNVVRGEEEKSASATQYFFFQMSQVFFKGTVSPNKGEKIMLEKKKKKKKSSFGPPRLPLIPVSLPDEWRRGVGQ